MVDDAYNRWDTDIRTGQTSILIAPDNDTVAMLNERAQADRVGSGAVDAEATVDLSDGLHAGRGDTILARRNDRHLLDDTGDFIRNGTLIAISDAPNPEAPSQGSARTTAQESSWRQLSRRVRGTRLRHHRPPLPRNHRGHRPHLGQ